MSATRYRFYASSPSAERGVQVHLAADPQAGERVLYANGKNIIVRNLLNPLIADEYTGHHCNVTSVRWSPDGNYIASGDIKGGVRVWNATKFFQTTTNLTESSMSSATVEVSEPKLSNTYFNGRVNDLAWDNTGKRLLMAGQGNMNYINAISLDTGSRLGEFAGHHKAVLACDLRQIDSKFHAITASEDSLVNIYEGLPFRFRKSLRDHQGFVHDCRFSGTGLHFATSGADRRIFLYETSGHEKIQEFKESETSYAHIGSIFGICWNHENSRLVSASADQSVKLWDVMTGKLIHSFEVGQKGDFMSQQMGCLWLESYIVSLSLSGTLHLFDPRLPNGPRKSIYGHSKAITSMSISKSHNEIFTGSYDGRICSWPLEDADVKIFTRIGQKNQISGLHALSRELVSVSMDSTISVAQISGDPVETITSKLETVPRQSCCDENGLVAIIFSSSLELWKHCNMESRLPLSFPPTSVAISKCGKIVAVGSERGALHFFKVLNDMENRLSMQVLHFCQAPTQAALKSLSFNNDGTMLAIGDAVSLVLVYDLERKQFDGNNWIFHSACVNSVAWSPSQRYIASGSLDTHVYIWSLDNPGSRICIRRAHRESVVAVSFVTDTLLASVGQDASLKTWSITYI